VNRREIILNFSLLAIILVVAYGVTKGSRDIESLPAPKPFSAGATPKAETDFNPSEVSKIYTNLGETKLFRAIMTPTPTPTPTPPPPEKTPDIENALKGWRLMSAGDGEATVEDRGAKEGDENRVFILKVGESRPITDGGKTMNATLKALNETGDLPMAEFTLEGTDAVKKLKMTIE
jgi:hypothetical protein